MLSDSPLVLSDVDDVGVRTLTLNRPDRMNAWIPPMQTALFDAFDEAAASPEVRVVVLTGAGRGFCPGADMQHLAELSTGTNAAAPIVPERRPIIHAMSVPKPIVCAINGACAGIGLAVAMSCDIRFVARDAKLTTAFAKLGLVAEHGLSWTLPQACGYATAKELLMSARRFTGTEAAALGVAHAALPDDELMNHTLGYARDLAVQSSPVSFATMSGNSHAPRSRPSTRPWAKPTSCLPRPRRAPTSLKASGRSPDAASRRSLRSVGAPRSRTRSRQPRRPTAVRTVRTASPPGVLGRVARMVSPSSSAAGSCNGRSARLAA